MKLAIMQPYFLPYIGYFQLIHAVDRFVIYDDVQFIKRGWINRNRMLNQGSDHMFTIPLAKAPRDQLINQRTINGLAWEKDRIKLMSLIKRSYGKAPFFESSLKTIEACMDAQTDLLADFITHTLEICCQSLGIKTPMMRASELDIDRKLKGEDRILSICEQLGATQYINACGGQDLYDRDHFNSRGIELFFIKSGEIAYPQFKNEFVPWLSIIDVMMFNSPARIRQYLDMYELV
jgi:hypothetical protein